MGLRAGEERDQGRPDVRDVAGARLGVRRHHDVRRQDQADRDRVRRGGDRGRAGGPHDPARHEAPARLLDEHRRARRRRGAALRLDPFDHLREADPILARLLDEVGAPSLERDPSRPAAHDHYGALVRAIVGQQLSVTAARAIYGRLIALFEGRPPTPQELLDQNPEQLRSAVGLSRAKVVFLRSLAEHVLSGELELERLEQLPDDEIVAEL
ncbi:MAG: hypothetical protein E6G41_12715, partial [Actinobacteria bacterium]